MRKTHYNYLDTRNAEGRAEWTRRFYGGSWYPDTMSAELRAQHTKAFDAKREAAREFLRGRYGR